MANVIIVSVNNYKMHMRIEIWCSDYQLSCLHNYIVSFLWGMHTMIIAQKLMIQVLGVWNICYIPRH